MIEQADFCRLIQRILYPEDRRGALNFSQCDCSNIYGAFGWNCSCFNRESCTMDLVLCAMQSVTVNFGFLLVLQLVLCLLLIRPE